MKTIKTNYLLFSVLAILGCREKYGLTVGTFPEEQATNLIELNSPYDEMPMRKLHTQGDDYTGHSPESSSGQAIWPLKNKL
jgi:hypothetical protein